MTDNIRVVQQSSKRVKIFIDFWNVVINARNQTKFDVKILWDKLTSEVVSQTNVRFEDHASGSLAGCFIFGSYNKSNGKELAFINETLDQYGSEPGLFFDFKERVAKETSHKCGGCGQPVQRSSELGVDVLLTVEMIKHGNMKEHEYLALVSSDRDYVPLLNFLKDQGQRVLHVSPGEAHRDMRAATWKQVPLRDSFSHFCKIEHETRIILTAPNHTSKTDEAIKILRDAGKSFNIIDITDKNQINDKDLEFIIRNLGITFHKKSERPTSLFPPKAFGQNMYDFRKAIVEGEAYGPLPAIINNGKTEATPSDHYNWLVYSGSNEIEIWEKHQNHRRDLA